MAFTKDKGISFAIEKFLGQHPEFDPWSPESRRGFRSFVSSAERDLKNYGLVIDGKSTILPKPDQELSSGWSMEDLRYMTSFQPRSPSDGSVSTDKPEVRAASIGHRDLLRMILTLF
jgi:hypothetical protein